MFSVGENKSLQNMRTKAAKLHPDKKKEKKKRETTKQNMGYLTVVIFFAALKQAFH